MGVPVTPIYIFFYVRSPEGSPPFFYGEYFSGFFLEPFPGATAPAALATATAIIITAVITAIVIGGTLIRVKVFPFKETFSKVSLSIFL